MIFEATRKRLDKQEVAREEFDAFLKKWIERHELRSEVYRGISYLMSSYVRMEIE
jgi:hypothetical protein